MQLRFKRIGILGGTFNPIHCGHLIIAESVREGFGLERVLLIPSGLPPHKPDSEVIDPEQRYEMVRRAAGSNQFFEASRVEIDTNGYTYTVNTLQALKKTYGDETALYFIIGADVIPELTSWKEFRTVFGLCEFIAVRRPGFGKKSIEAVIKRLKSEYAARINLVDAPLIDISSSEIRERCAAGKSIKYLVAEGVEDFIKVGGLYRKPI
jgi:nicotinate-nucleotide adenylyltransferase